jgi:hypothetical protein
MKFHRPLAAAAALAVALAPVAFAKGKPEDPGSTGKAHAKPKNVVFKGVVVSSDATTVTVTVRKATKHGRALVGTDVAFTAAKVKVADTNGDGVRNTADIAAGDRVVVQARIAKDSVAPYAARKVVDQTRPKSSPGDEDEAEDAPAS